MKLYFLYIVTIFLFFINISNAEQNIAFIDMNKIISTSKPGLSIILQLKNISNKNLTFLKNKEKKFKEKETKLISQKNIISEIEFKKKIDDLKSEINDYNKNRNKKIENFKKLKINNTNKLLKLINPILVKYSNDKDISIILQKKNLIIGKTELDITDEIIKIINTNIKEFEIK